MAMLVLGLSTFTSARADWPSSYSVNLPICVNAAAQLNPVIASDGTGGAFIAWEDDRSGNYDVYVSRVTANGAVDPAWPANGRLLCGASGSQNFPTLVVSGGQAVVGWIDHRTAGYDVYAGRVFADGTVDAAWPVNGRLVFHLSDATLSFSTRVLLIPDGAGGALVTCSDSLHELDVRAHHVLANGTLDPAWPTGGTVLCDAPHDQLPTAMVGDDHGGAIVVWDDRRSGTDFGVYAQHVRADGAVDPAWPAQGRTVCDTAFDQWGGQAVADRVGGAIVIWNDHRNQNDDLYAHHVQASGALDPSWPTNGRVVCLASGDQRVSSAIADGTGGLLAAWMDQRLGGWDAYAQHITASGTADPTWPGNGRKLTDDLDDQYSPVLASDLMGGAIAMWLDYYNVPSAVVGVRVQADGTLDPSWPAGGQRTCWTTGDRTYPSITSDGVGGAIAVWSDGRTSPRLDVYAQRVTRAGVLGGSVTDVGPRGPAPVALRVLGGQPLHGDRVAVEFERVGSGPATLELWDVAGRLIASADVSTLSSGRLTLASGSRLRGSVYFVRLRQQGRPLWARAVVLP